jgi:hypothetical protein
LSYSEKKVNLIIYRYRDIYKIMMIIIIIIISIFLRFEIWGKKKTTTQHQNKNLKLKTWLIKWMREDIHNREKEKN